MGAAKQRIAANHGRTQETPDMAARIAHVEHHLLLEPTLERDTFSPASLVARMAWYDTPGLSLALIDGGQVAWTRAYGVRERGHADAVTPDTLFQASSLSKPVTAMAALRLVGEGALDLDEDVNTYLRSWKVPPNGTWQPRVTVRQLLCHGGGMTVPGFVGYHRQRPRPTLLQLLDGLAPANSPPIRVDTIPGLQVRYSGGGFMVVQQLLMDVTGLPFAELMQTLVLEPLQMYHSTYEQPLPPSRWDTAASGHLVGGGVLDGRWHIYPEQAAGGLWTTAADLATFVNSLGRTVAGAPHPILTDALATEMLAPQVEPGFGLGIGLGGSGRDRRVYHNGSNRGFKTMLVSYPERGQGAVVLTNAEQGWGVAEEVLRGIADVYGWPRTASPWAGALPPAPTTTIVDPAMAQHYAGRYEVATGLAVEIMAQDTRIWCRMGNQMSMHLHPQSETDFVAHEVNVAVSFSVDSENRVRGLQVIQNGRTLHATKVREQA